MIKFIHRLLNPHCPDCIEEELSKSKYSAYDTLARALEQSNYEKKILLAQLIELTKPVEVVPQEKQQIDFENIKPRVTPWHVRKQMLEAEDKIKAQKMREAQAKTGTAAADLQRGPTGGLTADITDTSRKQSTEELERELGIGEGA